MGIKEYNQSMARKFLNKIISLAAALILAFCLTGCSEDLLTESGNLLSDPEASEKEQEGADLSSEETVHEEGESSSESTFRGDFSEESSEEEYIIVSSEDSFSLAEIDIPEYEGEDSVEINGGVPFFSDEDLSTEFYIQLTELDSLGRAGSAMMCADEEHIQTGERSDISDIHPSGWHSGGIYNRSHLLMWKLSGCNDERNLITGTESFNQETMLYYEEQITAFLWDNEDMHVIYRVTPLFEEDELVARGVLMEAMSAEDNGEGLMFCVFCYNTEDGYDIDYEDGGYYW